MRSYDLNLCIQVKLRCSFFISWSVSSICRNRPTVSLAQCFPVRIIRDSLAASKFTLCFALIRYPGSNPMGVKHLVMPKPGIKPVNRESKPGAIHSVTVSPQGLYFLCYNRFWLFSQMVANLCLMFGNLLWRFTQLKEWRRHHHQTMFHIGQRRWF